MKTAVILLLVAAFGMTSCATIITGSSDAVSFDSNPDDAKVFVDGLIVGRTPCQAQVGRGWGKGEIRMENMDTGEVRDVTVPRVLNGWYFGNLAFGLSGVVIGGILIDLPTGNLRKTPSGTTIFVDFSRPAPANPANPERKLSEHKSRRRS